MLTRGKLLGDIMDGLGQLNFVLQTRSKLGLYDLNKYCEDFIKDFLNLIYGYNLVNLNETRSNEPGLDLGDEVQKLGIQVTTDKKSTKINHTFEKITDEQKARYERFVILILGAKQSSYDGINPELASNLHFEIENDIWDFGDLERAIVSLPLDKIKSTYDFLQSNLIRVFSDLDVGTTPSGEATSMLDQLEPRPVNKYMGCSNLVTHINEKHRVNLRIDDMNPSYQMFYNQLAELP
ncbi:SMEK domain-containing protein [Paenibacillus sp. 19GGS1-52]|uniref:SMEK domain-containing protein n=1 Tax=Paenibacillus sp. 19GGS1-52 TaxID=2758563 RepID=UPI001EFB34B2|nr:SMEK domain-containing protein [Paenibacillus sp. 19GGS1-52]ULO04852.1 SMEK domain-containing protein [Paenibacillus sp. 19GGS1-52]